MKTKLLFLTLVLLAASGALFAQNAAPIQGGNISASSTNCTVSFSCVWESVLPQNAGTTTVNLAGTFVETLVVERSNNGGQSWATIDTLSAVGTTTYSTNGFTDIRVRCSAFTSGSAAVTISTGLLQVQGVVSGGSSSSASSALTSVVQSGLVAEYRILPTETAAALVDYSTGGNTAQGTVGTAPTIAAITGGLVCGGAGAVKLPAALNSALTVQMYVSYQPSSNSSATNTLLGGNGANAISLLLYGSTVNDIWGPPISGGSRIRSVSPGNTFKSASRDVFTGTGVLSFLMDTNDRFFINTQEVDYIQSSNSAGLQTNGQYDLCGAASFANATIYYVAFYSRVLTTAEVAQNVQFMTNAMAARNVSPSLLPTDGFNQAVCDGDSLTASGGSTYCSTLIGLGLPGPAVTNFLSFPVYKIADQGKQGGGAAIAFQSNHTVDTMYRPNASNNVDALWVGTNDNNAALSYPLIRANCTARRLVGFKCLVGTMISRTGEDTTKNQLNALLRAHWAEFADGLMDFASNPNLGADGASANGTFFTDGIHLTAAGNLIVNNIGQRAMDRVFGNVDISGNVQTAPPQYQFVQSITTNCTTGASCTAVFPNVNVVGNFIHVAILGPTGLQTINTPTDSHAATYTSTSAAVGVNGAQNMQAFFTPNIAAGANTVTVTFGGSGSNAIIIASEWSGVLSAAPLDASATNRTQAANPLTSNAVTTTATNELLIAYGFGTSNVGTWAEGIGFSPRVNNAATTSGALADSLSVAAGAYTASFSYSGALTNGGVGIAAFKVGTPAGTYAMADQDVILFCNPSANTTAVNTTINLPDAIGLTGQIVTVKNTQAAGASTCTVAAVNSETIDGAASVVVANKATLILKAVLVSPQAGGVNWVQLQNN